MIKTKLKDSNPMKQWQICTISKLISLMCLITQAVCGSTDSNSDRSANAVDRQEDLQSSAKYIISKTMSEVLSDDMMRLITKTQESVAQPSSTHLTYTLLDCNPVFLSLNVLFPDHGSETAQRLKDLYTALYARMVEYTAPDAKFLHLVSQPLCLVDDTIAYHEARRNLSDDITWFVSEIKKGMGKGPLSLGVSATVALLLITNEMSNLNKAGQICVLACLRAIDTARALAIALMSRIPMGFLRWLPSAIAQKKCADYQIIRAALAFIKLLSDDNAESEILPKLQEFLCNCIGIFKADATINRSMLWYIYAIDVAISKDLSPDAHQRAECTRLREVFAKDGFALRNEWPPALWEDMMRHAMLIFVTDMLDALESAALNKTRPLTPTRSFLFEQCVPDAAIITLARLLLLLPNLNDKAGSKERKKYRHFTWHVLNSLQALFNAWLRNKEMSIATIDTLLGVIQNSSATSIVPALIKTYKTHHAVQPAVSEANTIRFWLAPAMGEKAETAHECILLHPRDSSTDRWLALADTLVNEMFAKKHNLRAMFPMSMLTMGPIARFMFLWHILGSHRSDLCAEDSQAGRPAVHLDLAKSTFTGTFLVYLLHDKTVLQIIDSVPVAVTGATTQVEPAPGGTSGTDPFTQPVLQLFTAECIDNVRDALVEAWLALLENVTNSQHYQHSRSAFTETGDMSKSMAARTKDRYLYVLASMLASRRLREVIKTRLAKNPFVSRAIRLIWRSLAATLAEGPEILKSAPAVTPLVYVPGISVRAPIAAANAIALLRLTRFLLENVDCTPPLHNTPVFSTIYEGMEALLDIIATTPSKIILNECVEQLKSWMKIQMARQRIKEGNRVIMQHLCSLLKYRLATDCGYLSQASRNVFIHLLFKFNR